MTRHRSIELWEEDVLRVFASCNYNTKLAKLLHRDLDVVIYHDM
jgi:hypothetical protein